MATAAQITEMQERYQKLEREMIPVEAFFNMQLEDYLKKEIELGRMHGIFLDLDFKLLTVSSTHAIFIAYPDTVFDRSTDQMVRTTMSKVAVPLISMARAETVTS
jgi:hypothetical protein